MKVPKSVDDIKMHVLDVGELKELEKNVNTAGL